VAGPKKTGTDNKRPCLKVGDFVQKITSRILNPNHAARKLAQDAGPPGGKDAQAFQEIDNTAD